MTKGAPDKLTASNCFDFFKEGIGPRTHYGAEIIFRGGGGKKVAPGVTIIEKVFKPGAAGGTVVDDQIRHQGIIRRYGFNIIPVAEGFINTGIVEHRETIVRGVRVKRQNMDAIYRVFHIAI